MPDTLRTSTTVPTDHHKRAVLNKKRRKVKRKMTVGQKIKLLQREGKKHDQAVAIALDMQRRGELRK